MPHVLRDFYTEQISYNREGLRKDRTEGSVSEEWQGHRQAQTIGAAAST